MKKKLYLFFIYWLITSTAVAQQISQSEALKDAISFYGAGTKFVLVCIGGTEDAPDYYVYNVDQGPGFVIVAGDRRMLDLIPVYSQTGHFDVDNLPDAFRDLLANYSQEVNRMRKQPASDSQTRIATRSNNSSLADITKVGPLLGEIIWDQTSPYNDQCPIINGVHAVTGCVATGTAQIMKYYAWPLQGKGTVGKVDYSKATYNWDLMLPVYNANSSVDQKAEVAKLMFHVGNASEMKYGTNGSGASLRLLTKALINNFSYSSDLQTVYRTTYTDNEWFQMMKREIDLKRPVANTGSGNPGDHFFVCDGYDSDGRVHYNYGWGGSSNGYVALSACLFPNLNEALIGFIPNNITVADADKAAPQIVLVGAMNSSTYEPKLGVKFNISTRVANYSYTDFNGNLALALCQGGKMIGSPLKQVAQQVPGIAVNNVPTLAEGAKNILFTDVLIPANTAAGDYQLCLMAQLGSAWFPALCVVDDVTKEINVTIKNGTAYFTYPVGEKGSKLELMSPIDINVANNRATLRCSIRNVDDFYNCENVEVSVLVAPNNELIPTVWKRTRIDNLPSGFVKELEITDISLPAGTSVNSCRFYLAYNPVNNAPGKDRDIASVPMFPSKYNFKSYNIPAERLISNVDFKKTAIPDDYKKYNSKGEEDENAWKKGILSFATSGGKDCLLVTSAIHVTDENDVLEWSTSNMYSSELPFTVYISTEGQAFSNFAAPVYEKVMPAAGIARLSLSEYAGKDIYIAFESPIDGQYSLIYFNLLNIKTPKDISVQEVLMAGSVKEGQEIPVKVKVKNHSAATVREISASYTVGDKTVNEIFKSDIAFNNTQEFTFAEPIIVSGTAGDVVPVKVHVQQDGEDTAQLGNNDGTTQYTLMNFFPKRGALIFKTTKVGCYGCMLTYGALDKADEDYPKLTAAVELWRNGTFSTPDFPNYTVSGTTPSFFVNGRYQYSIEGVLNGLRDISFTDNPPADLAVTAAYEDENSRKLKINIKTLFALPIKGEYRIGAIIIENNVINKEGQISGTHPTGVKLVKNHVPIGVIGKYDGSTGMRIENPRAEEYTYACEYVIPDELEYRYRKDNVQVIAVLYDSNGQILNSSLNSYYLKLPETSGLTFEPIEGYSNFKSIYELKSVGNNYESITNYRTTINAGNKYQFRIKKDITWNGKHPKLIVNKEADYNKFKEEVLEADANGIYTIEEAQMHYNITIEAAEGELPEPQPEQAFEVKYKGEVLKDGSIITIDNYELQESDMTMKFEVEVTNTSRAAYSMRMRKVESVLMQHTSNSVCWDQCMEPEDEYANSLNIAPGEVQRPRADFILNFDGEPVKGTSIVKYTFMTSNKMDDPLSVEVHYAYDGSLVGFDGLAHLNSFNVWTDNGIVLINTEEAMAVSLYGVDGCVVRQLQLVPGVNRITGLAKGVYLVNGHKVIL